MSAESVARKTLIAGTSVDDYRLFEILGWAFSHEPTREAYRLSTGEDVAPALDRYRAWVEENIIGEAGEGA